MSFATVSPYDWCLANWSAPVPVFAGTTTRIGGVSDGAHAENNLALHTGDEVAHVCENRLRLGNALRGAPIQWLNQVHGIEQVNVAAATTRRVPVADAMWTQQRGIALAILTADCVPILLADEAGSLIAAAHAGWQGLLAGVVPNLLANLPAQTQQLCAWIGPCISAQRYEVGREVWSRFCGDYPAAVLAHPDDPDKRLLDLVAVSREQLRRVGVVHIAEARVCTYEDRRFFSHRRHTHSGSAGSQCGRMASVICLPADY